MVGAIFIGTFLPLALLMLLLRHSRPVFSCFCWGMLAFLVVRLSSPSLYDLLGISHDLSVTAVFIGPPYEEFLKVLPVVVAAIVSGRSLIPFYYILGMTAGIGFAVEENLNLLADMSSSSDPNNSMIIMIMRSFSTCLMHGVATGFIGYMLTMTRRGEGRARFAWPVFGWVIATVYHAFFNWLMLRELILIGLLIAMGLFFVFLFRMKKLEPKAEETQGTVWQ